jgi:UDP-N-acetyl-2-amino-2-deoxyglucuronate dehydrogenase
MVMGKKYIILGGAGFIAPRHMKAIQETGGEIIAVADPHDSIGIIDRYSKSAVYYNDELTCLYENYNRADYCVIATPNHTHFNLIRAALACKFDVICEKPIVTASVDIPALKYAEEATGNHIYGVMQLRYHPSVELINKYKNSNGKNQIVVVYNTPRGNWYQKSWKGSAIHSGGLAMNIGIHFFDLLLWKFGAVEDIGYHFTNEERTASDGFFVLDNAEVSYNLSIAPDVVPEKRFLINGQSVDLLSGFETLHTRVYQEILAGRGLGIDRVSPAIELTEEINRIAQLNNEPESA